MFTMISTVLVFITSYSAQRHQYNFTPPSSCLSVVCSSLQLIGPGSPGDSVRLWLWRLQCLKVHLNCFKSPDFSGRSCRQIVPRETLKDYLTGALKLYLSKPRKSKRKYEALTPSPDSPATRRASHRRDRHGGHGERGQQASQQR